VTQPDRNPGTVPSYPDLRTHLTRLDDLGLLMRVHRTVNKDREIHPLVRLQYRGGLPEEERKAWLFEAVTDDQGRHYDMPVVVGALAASPRVYAAGLGCDPDDIAAVWQSVATQRIDPVLVDTGPIHEVVVTGNALTTGTAGVTSLPIPISTPGYDNAPYTTCSHWITKDLVTGQRNVGNYRGQVKAPDRLGCYIGSEQDGAAHWRTAQRLGVPLPAALVIGAPPVVSYAAVTKLPQGDDELALAGALAGEPIRLVKCRTVDLEVPAEAEIVVEGLLHTDQLEPEGPFGESHGYMHLRGLAPFFEVTCITRRRQAILPSFISQVTPSESSVIKKMSYQPLFMDHLRRSCRAPFVKDVHLYEPMINLRGLIIVQVARGTPTEEVNRALLAATSFHPGVGKVVIAVDDDIDPRSLEMVMWAVCVRSDPATDVQIVGPLRRGHGPRGPGSSSQEGHLLIVATAREALPPISLPGREFMENALHLWADLGLPAFTPTSPWHGFGEDDWSEEYAVEAELAVQGRAVETGEKLATRRESASGRGPVI
jgi:4-hydroxy-3-polyprenylbenzoate decarboxylase